MGCHSMRSYRILYQSIFRLFDNNHRATCRYIKFVIRYFLVQEMHYPRGCQHREIRCERSKQKQPSVDVFSNFENYTIQVEYELKINLNVKFEKKMLKNKALCSQHPFLFPSILLPRKGYNYSGPKYIFEKIVIAYCN